MPRILLFAFLLCSACVAPVAVSADGDVVEEAPPDDVIATLTPVYYNGVPAYWWGNHWYFRGGGGWRTYRSEPAFLGSYRAQHVVHRAYYGRARPAVRGRR